MSAKTLDDALNKLAKWRKFFAGWQLGTRLDTDGEYKAVADQRELFMIMRAELNALVWLLVSKGVFTQAEFDKALEVAARQLDHSYEERFPGFRTTAMGLSMKMPEAAETMRRLGFPP